MKLTFQEIERDNPPAKSARLWFLGGSSFSIKFHDQPTIFIDLDAARFDPHLPESGNAPALDLKRSVFLPFDISEIKTKTAYLSTHEHRDHCDEISATWILKQGGIFIGPRSSCERANSWGSFRDNVIELDGTKFQSTKFGDVSILSAPNDNPTASSSNSYVVSFEGINILHNGDSLYNSEMYGNLADKFKIDIAIINLGQNPVGRTWYHSPTDVVRAAIDLRPKILLPHHFDKWYVALEDPEKVERVARLSYPAVLDKTRFVVLKQGEAILIP